MNTRHVSKISVLSLILIGLVLPFQNCSSEIRDDGLMKSIPQASTSTTIPTENPSDGIIQADYSTFQNQRLKANLFTLFKEKETFSRYTITMFPTKGTLTVLDHRSGKFIYDPSLDFTGVDEFSYVETRTDGNKTERVTKIYVVKSTMLGDMQPAMAIRAMGCIGCHSNVASNIITDYGVGGDGKTRDYSFGKGSFGKFMPATPTAVIGLNSGNVYFDHNSSPAQRGSDYTRASSIGNMGTINMAAGTQIMIPQGLAFPSDLGAQPMNWWAPTTLAMTSESFVSIVNRVLGRVAAAPFSYTVKQYLEGLRPGLEGTEFPRLQVKELRSLYIGAPTKDRIAATRAEAAVVAEKGLNPEFIYVKESSSSPNLTGIDVVGNVIYARSNFTCDGDLFVTKKLVMEDMTLNTTLGCRIYSPEIIYLQGRVMYPANKPYANLQLSSSRAIMAGIGANDCGLANGVDSLANRGGGWWVPSVFTRTDEPAQGTMTGPEVTMAKIVSDSAPLNLSDARCIEKRLHDSGALPAAVPSPLFERVLWNAPHVHTAFRGDIAGVIVAEVPILAVGNVKYNFHEVFTMVPVLPMLSPSDWLMVIEK